MSRKLFAYYYYDNNKIDVYKFHKHDGSLSYDGSIVLGNDEKYTAFTHYTSWINNRKAYTASMQFGPASLTPKGTRIIGPGLWLLDLESRTAKQVNDGGVYRSASDLVVEGTEVKNWVT